MATEYNCALCDYKTNEKSNYTRHIKSTKHIIRTYDINDDVTAGTASDSKPSSNDENEELKEAVKQLNDKMNEKDEEIIELQENVDHLLNSLSELRILIKDKLKIYP